MHKKSHDAQGGEMAEEAETTLPGVIYHEHLFGQRQLFLNEAEQFCYSVPKCFRQSPETGTGIVNVFARIEQKTSEGQKTAAKEQGCLGQKRLKLGRNAGDTVLAWQLPSRIH